MEAKLSPEEPQEAGCPPCALGKAFSVDAWYILKISRRFKKFFWTERDR